MMQVLISGLAIGGLYTLVAMGFTLKLGIADIVNVAHGAFVVIGMYIVYFAVTDYGVPEHLAAALAAIFVVLLSLVVYVVLVGPSRLGTGGHEEQIVYTLLILSGAGLVLQLLFGTELRTLPVSSSSVKIFGAFVTREQIIAFVTAVVVAGALYFVFTRTLIGKIARVAGAYESGARAVGIPVERVFMLVFLVGSGLAGLAGGLAMTIIPVEPYLGFEFVIVAFLVSISAGLGFGKTALVGLAFGVVEAGFGRYAGPAVGQVWTYTFFLVVLAMVTGGVPRGVRSMGRVLARGSRV